MGVNFVFSSCVQEKQPKKPHILKNGRKKVSYPAVHAKGWGVTRDSLGPILCPYRERAQAGCLVLGPSH